MFRQNSGAMRREIAKVYLPSLRGAKRRSNPFLLALWIASRSLSSGAHSRDPLARNDEEKLRRVGKGALAPCPPFLLEDAGGHAALCPPYGSAMTGRTERK